MGDHQTKRLDEEERCARCGTTGRKPVRHAEHEQCEHEVERNEHAGREVTALDTGGRRPRLEGDECERIRRKCDPLRCADERGNAHCAGLGTDGGHAHTVAAYPSPVSTLLVVNPQATSAVDWVPSVIAQAFGTLGDVDVVGTAYRGHARELAAHARQRGVERVIAFGGDGTLNEVVNGLLDGDGPVPALAVIPGGHTNVVARSIGLSTDPVEATAQLLESAKASHVEECNVGVANDRHFVFSAGLGVDAQVLRRVEEQRAQGVKASIPVYVASALLQFAFASPLGKPQMRITLADGATIDNVYTAIVQNLNPWTYIGNTPLTFAPDATPENGLSVYGIRSLDPVSLASVLGRAALKPEWLDNGRAAHDLAEFAVTAQTPLPFQVDGDVVGETGEVRFRLANRAIRLLTPVG